MFKMLVFLICFAFHPVHVTLTSLDYSPATGNLEAFIRMNLDDFLLDHNPNGNTILKESFFSRDKSSFESMERYINEKLLIKVNDKLTAGTLKDLNISNTDIEVKLVFICGRKPKTLTVRNLIMTNLFNDQSNLIIVKVGDFEEGAKLTPVLDEQIFKIN